MRMTRSAALILVLVFGTSAASTAQHSVTAADTTNDRAVGTSAATPRCLADNYTCQTNLSIFLEEDSWHLRTSKTPPTDRNYTMGFGISISGSWVARHSHDALLHLADRGIVTLVNATVGQLAPLRLPEDLPTQLVSPQNKRAYSELLSGTAFTPETIKVAGVQRGDRPYAFLLAWTTRRTALLRTSGHAVTTELTVGTIGSRLGRNVQRAIHSCARNDLMMTLCTRKKALPDSTPYDPKGWGNQVMDVPSVLLGWPTARYSMTVEWVTSPRTAIWGRGHWFDAIGGPGAEVGYYTDAYAGTRARIGYFTGSIYSWWQNPLSSTGGQIELRDLRAAEHVQRADTVWAPRLEWFIYGGARGRAWAYNALLQGYPGYGGYAFDRNNLQSLTAEGEAGFALLARFGCERRQSIQLAYEYLAARSREFDGPRARSHYWGGYFLTYGRSVAPAILALR